MKTLLTILVLTLFVLTAPVQAQLKVGDWQIAPTSTNLVRIPHGTNDTLKTILEWFETNGTYSVADLLRIAPDIDLDDTDDVTDIQDGGTIGTVGTIANIGGGNWRITFPASGTETGSYSRAYCVGFWPRYESTNTIAVTAGECMANGVYFYSAADITNIPVIGISTSAPAGAQGEKFAYVYLDYSASTSNAPAPTFTAVVGGLAEPAWSDSQFGYYAAEDRCVGVVKVGSSNVVSQFYYSLDGEFSYGGPIEAHFGTSVLANNIPSAGYWRHASITGATSVIDTSRLIPVNASELNVKIRSYDTSADHRGCWLTWVESSNTAYVASHESSDPGRALAGVRGYGIKFYDTQRMPVYPSRKLMVLVEADDNSDKWAVWARGWKVAR